MFYGQYPHKLNAKNQVTLPAKFREVIDSQKRADPTEGDGLYLLQADPRCLYLYTQKGVERIVEWLKSAGGPAAHADFRRQFLASVNPVDPDPHGRFVIPERRRLAAGIQKSVIFIGNADRIEIWADERWAQLEKTDPEAYETRIKDIVRDLLEW